MELYKAKFVVNIFILLRRLFLNFLNLLLYSLQPPCTIKTILGKYYIGFLKYFEDTSAAIWGLFY